MQEYIDFFSNHPVLTIGWIVTLFLLISGFIQFRLSKVKSINTQDTILLINKSGAIVVDVRPSDEFNKGHIVNAKNIEASQIEEGHFGGIENHKDTPIILVCDSGARTTGVGKKLAKAGFTQLHNLSTGMNGWVTQNLPTTMKR